MAYLSCCKLEVVFCVQSGPPSQQPSVVLASDVCQARGKGEARVSLRLDLRERKDEGIEDYVIVLYMVCVHVISLPHIDPREVLDTGCWEMRKKDNLVKY